MASNLADIRKGAGFRTQEALAEKIGVERVTVSRWESGDREPRLSMISLLARTLDVSEGDIVAVISKQRAKKPRT